MVAINLAPSSAVLRPDALAPAQLVNLGGKGRSLYELGRLAPMNVPAWFAVSDSVFALARARHGADAVIADILSELGPTSPRADITAAAAKIAGLLADLEVGPAADDIANAYEDLGAGYVAVRSSALDEDGAERSFAGCLDTSLYVRGRDAVLEAVVGCWRSAFSERSLAYRALHGALSEPIGVAVVVQRMIGGEVSGVLFSADPSNGDRERAIVTSTWGLGEGVVSGKLECDTFVIDRGGSVLDRDLADKSHAIVHDSERGAGTREIAISDARRNAASLEDVQLQQLAKIGWAIENAYGTPVDVEWTWTAEGPYVLQARPITTGAPKAPSLDHRRGTHRIWDNSNIVESYSGVTTPLTYSFARRAYSIVYKQAAELIGVDRADIDANADLFEQMIGLLRGRVYYNLESWYQALKLLPGYRFNSEFMEQMMGVSESLRAQSPDTQASAAQRYLVELPRTLASLAKLLRRFAGSDKLIADFYTHFEEAFADIDELDRHTMSFDELVWAYLECERRLMRNWQAPIVNDTMAMMFFGALRKALDSWGLGADALHNDLMCGEGGLYSTEPTRDLLELMIDIRKDDALCAVMGASSPRELRIAVESDPRFGWLRVRIASHVDRFGDRCIDELKLEEPTLRDDPTFIYAALKGYLSAPPITPDELETREAALRIAAESKVAEALRRRPDRRRIFNWLVAGARRHIKHRENLRFARTRAFGLVRRLVVSMGDRLVEAGKLDRSEDVFYLEMNELVAFARGTATTTDLRGLAAVRRAEYDRLRAGAAPPDRFETDGAVYFDDRVIAGATVQTLARAATGDVLSGVAASPGRVRAPARVITDPRDIELRGEVLVANRTDPGWVPLFPSAAAVVVERGSVLSHSAIVAREFGIPCVVGLRGVMDQLRDGVLVEVDGNAGTVTVLD